MSSSPSPKLSGVLKCTISGASPVTVRSYIFGEWYDGVPNSGGSDSGGGGGEGSGGSSSSSTVVS